MELLRKFFGSGSGEGDSSGKDDSADHEDKDYRMRECFYGWKDRSETIIPGLRRDRENLLAKGVAEDSATIRDIDREIEEKNMEAERMHSEFLELWSELGYTGNWPEWPV